jgi:hypothetical protein
MLASASPAFVVLLISASIAAVAGVAATSTRSMTSA